MTAAAPSPGRMAPLGRAPHGSAAASVGARVEALALSLGTRVSAGPILLGCVLVILIGAQSMLGALQGMDRDIKLMSEELAIANGGLDILNESMDSLPPTSRHLGAIVTTVHDTAGEVDRSSAALGGLATTTDQLGGRIGSISASTTSMRGSLERVGGSTTQLRSTVDDLNVKVGPLVDTQHAMLGQTRLMVDGLGRMGNSLAYTVRVLNFITAPPGGGSFAIRADLPKEALPSLPGIAANAEPVSVFPRGSWPVYTGP